MEGKNRISSHFKKPISNGKINYRKHSFSNRRSGPINPPYLTPLTRLRRFKEIRDRNLKYKVRPMDLTEVENANENNLEIPAMKVKTSDEKLTNGDEKQNGVVNHPENSGNNENEIEGSKVEDTRKSSKKSFKVNEDKKGGNLIELKANEEKESPKISLNKNEEQEQSLKTSKKEGENSKRTLKKNEDSEESPKTSKKIEEISNQKSKSDESPRRTSKRSEDSPRRTSKRIEEKIEKSLSDKEIQYLVNGENEEREFIDVEEEIIVDVIGETEESEEPTPDRDVDDLVVEVHETKKQYFEEVIRTPMTSDPIIRAKFGQKVKGRRPLRGFITPYSGSKRKADSYLREGTPDEKKFLPDTPSTESPGWRYIASPSSFFWKCKEDITPSRERVYSPDDSMAVNVDDSINNRLDESQLQLANPEQSKSSWRCNIM